MSQEQSSLTSPCPTPGSFVPGTRLTSLVSLYKFYGLRLTAYGLRLTAHGSRLTSHVSRLTSHRLTLTIQFPHHNPSLVVTSAMLNAMTNEPRVAVLPQC